MNKRELTAKQQYEDFLHSYFTEKNPQKAITYVTDDFSMILPDSPSPIIGKEQLKDVMEVSLPSISHDAVLLTQTAACTDLEDHTIEISASALITGLLLPFGITRLWLRLRAVLSDPGQNCLITKIDGTSISLVPGHVNCTVTSDTNNRFNTLAASIPGGVFEAFLDSHLTLLYGSQNVYSLYGYTKEQFSEEQQNRLANLIHSEDLASIYSGISHALKTDTHEVSLENRIIRRNGTIGWVLIRGTISSENTLDGVIIDITDRKKIEEKLQISEERLRIAVEKSSNYVFDYNIITRQMIQPEGISSVYDLPPIMEGVPQSLVDNGTIYPESAEVFLQMYADIRQGKPTASCRVKTHSRAGSVVWNHLTLTTIYDHNQRPVRAIGLIEDITKEKELEAAYFQEEQYRGAMLSNALLYIEMNITQDTFCKRKGSWNFNFDDENSHKYSKLMESVVEHSVVREFQKSYQETFCLENARRSFFNGVYELHLEYLRYMDDGRTAWMQNTMTLVQDVLTNDIKGFIYVRDIDFQKKAELKLQFESQHDSLTNLYNKMTTESKIKELLEKNPDDPHVLFILDLDYFKDINDTYGHYVGDRVLSETAKRLQNLTGPSDIVGRIGGDEFVIFIDKLSTAAIADDLSQTIRDAFSKPYQISDHTLTITCSIGAAISGIHGVTFKELYKKADIALYKAKKSGRNCQIRYRSFMDDQSFISCCSKIDSTNDNI